MFLATWPLCFWFYYVHMPMWLFYLFECIFYYQNKKGCILLYHSFYMDRVKRIWYLSPMRAAKVQASLRIRAVSPEPPLLAHTSSESSETFRQKARSLAPLNGWACAIKMCHDGMLEDTNSLDGAHIVIVWFNWLHRVCIFVCLFVFVELKRVSR